MATISVVAIGAVFLNLRALEQSRISQYRNLMENLTSMAVSYLQAGRTRELQDLINMQSHGPDVEFVNIYADEKFIVRLGEEHEFDFPEKLLTPRTGEGETVIRQGARLWLGKKIAFRDGRSRKTGVMVAVFSLQELQSRQHNIFWATVVILALIVAVLVLFYLLDKTRHEIQMKNEDLQKIRERLEHEEKTRTEMIKAIAHDALHYVTVIKMIIDNQETLRRKKREQNGSYVREILESNDSLTQLLENLKYNEYLSKGLLVNRPRSVAWVEFVDAVLISMKELFSKKRVEVVFSHHHEPYKVMVDRELAKRVLLNLFHNAFKFTRPDSRVEIWLGRENGNIRTSIRDRGAGIAPDKWREVFEPSVRLEDSAFVRAEDMRGSGLGLSNARQFVVLSGGEMGIAESHINQGTTVYFTLPLSGETYGLDIEVKR